jgi:lysine 2,3-aminomutase
MLRQTSNLDQIRVALLERINYRHFMAYSEHTGIHPLDLVIIRDAARAWRGILHPRSEKLVNFSVLNALLDVAQGRLRPELTAAFWAEIHHLVTAIDGNVRIHSIDARVMTSALKGRDAAQWRSAQLDWLGKSLADRSTRYRHGLNDDVIMQRNQHRAEILTAFGGSENDWQEWRWHLKHIIRNAENLERVVTLSAEEKKRIALALEQGLPFGITPYYAMLFDQPADTDHDRAIRAQVIPPLSYLDAFASIPHDGVATDFMQEMDNSPIDLVTRRYVAVAILKPYASCPQICVYCQRNWEIHEPLAQGAMAPKKQIDEAIAWLSDHPTIHDVLLTGGDPLVLSDAWLKKLLGALAAIPHIERIRIGTRMLATLPQRFNTPLVKLLKTYQLPGRREICVVTHIQHPYELTPELVKAVNRLRQEGIAVYNQLVYTFYVSRRFEAAMLRRLLRRCGIEPYYTFYPKGKLEMADYRVPIARLLQEQKEESRLFPGMERTDEPVYNVPGLGKNYLNSWQHRDLISIRPDGARMYEFHPWEKKIMPQQTYIGADVPILDYLERLKMIGETLEDYESIWYYY